jgi:mRNA deadenylase 3'-5' endonuclease subunit Ccr4
MSNIFQVVSYNVLANCYVYPKRYSHIDPDHLRWEKRKIALLKRLESFKAEIICLQEVEKEAFALFERSLSETGYEGLYAQKGQQKPDGCAVFFKQEKLRFKSHRTIYYHDGGVTADSGHLAMLLHFESASGTIGLANTHLKWDRGGKPKQQHLGYRQIKELLNRYMLTDQVADHWILCGDFNAQPDSAIIEELRSHGFEDAYKGQEQCTANPNRRAKRIDYIFHSPGLRARPAKLMEIDDFTPLPSATEPSDHLAIMATIEAAFGASAIAN